MPNVRVSTAFFLYCVTCNLIKMIFYASRRGKIHYLLHLNSFWRVTTPTTEFLFRWMGYDDIVWSLKSQVYGLITSYIAFIRLLAPESNIVAHMLVLICRCGSVCSYVELLMSLYYTRWCWCSWAFSLDYIYMNMLNCIHVPCSVFYFLQWTA